MLNVEAHVLRVALVPRVSTDEQVKTGDSLQAQEDALVKYATENNMKIVGIYRDEGHSARKPVLKRPVMLQLLEDVKAGKIDRILVTKLDRWFRNVEQYYAVQRILDKHDVAWQAILENYETASADGRFKVNIMLSVAENESDRTSERIKFVFDSKLAKKECYFKLPLGYTTEMIDGVRRVVKDPETQHIVEDFFQRAMATSIRVAAEEMNIKYDRVHPYKYWWQITKRELYTGMYKGIEDFAPAYITQEEFENLNNKRKTIRKTKQNRVYIFTGLLRCPNCGRRLGGKYCTSGRAYNKEYMYYRCVGKLAGTCDFKIVTEKNIEEYLLENVRKEMEQLVLSAETTPKEEKKSKPKKSEVEKLNEKLRRTNVAFFAGNMTDEEYAEQTKTIKEQIAKAQAAEAREEKPVDTKAVKAFLETDFESIYETLTKEERRTLWRSVVDEIVLDGTEPVGIKIKA
ncbi:MAG: recombinase family protein [Oscillospiraceae bacterium]|nr:recombinase family protein [Oscillospiraceae bacterium]